MVPLAFPWDAWFNQKTGNVGGYCNRVVLINAEKIFFFIFFFFCCQAVLIPSAGLNRAFNSASNGTLGIFCETLCSTTKQAMFVEFSSDYCCDITKKSCSSFFFFFVDKLSSFRPQGWIEHSILHPMVPLAFLWDAWFNQKTGNVRGNCNGVVLINAEKVFFFFFFFSFVVKLSSFWPHVWIEHSILHPMGPLAFLWDLWFNQKTGNVRGNCNRVVVINAEKMFFFIFFFFLAKLSSFRPQGWIEHSILHPLVPLAFLWDALFNQKTGNVRGIIKWPLLWYNEK